MQTSFEILNGEKLVKTCFKTMLRIYKSRDDLLVHRL